MIVETPADFDWETAMSRLATLRGRLNGKTMLPAFSNVLSMHRPAKNGK